MSQSIDNIDNRGTVTTVVYLLLFVLLALRAGGAVSHYCFDGMEPPVSIHFDNLSGHIEHGDETGHNDIEKQVLSDNLITKIFDLEASLIILALFLLGLLFLPNGKIYFHHASHRTFSLKKFLPPLRAPPLAA